ncbi:MAG: DUF4878 domain-containing protein [Gammaproteobacteria bacterium]|nr:DUF4878 domain-containing protein [Gammaproteobacteria bacterium]
MPTRKRITIILLLSVFLSACGIDQSDPEVVAKGYVEAIYYADVNLFKKLVEPKDYEATEDHKLFSDKDSTGKSETRKSRGDVSLISIDDTYINQDRARVRISVEFNNGERRILSISLHQKEGAWYVNPTSWARW